MYITTITENTVLGYVSLKTYDTSKHLFIRSLRLIKRNMEKEMFPQMAEATSGPDWDTHTAGLIPGASEEKEDPQVEKTSVGGPSGQATASQSKIGTTMMNETEALAKVSKPSHITRLPRTITNSADDGTLPSIKMYFGKPTKVYNGVFAETDVASTWSWQNVYDPIKTNAMYYDKLVGVYAFRATTVLTLQVNANRFQSGRYMLVHLPLGGADWSDPAMASYIKMKTYSAMQYTQLPHVEIDLATDSQIELRIPHVTFNNACPVTKSTETSFTKYTPGLFKIYPYMSLRAGASASTCGFTLWVHYEDVEIFSNMAPQMGGFENAERGTSGKMFGKVKDVLGMEVYTPGPVETIANKVRVISDSATRVPMLSAFAAPVSWLADIVGGVASIFGWSKPLQIAPAGDTHLALFHDLPNCDTKDNITSMSLTKDNRVDILPGFSGTSVDELSIDYLKKIYAYYDVVTWNSTDLVSTQLFKYPLSPGYFMKSATEEAHVMSLQTPIAFLSQFFHYYRGGLQFKFKIVKTEFHSGRLIFGFFPCDIPISGLGTEATFANLDYAQKTVIDVRDGVEWTMSVPYVSTTAFKRNARNATSYDEWYGYLCCYVLSPLIAPDGVTPDIKILIEVCGADDLEFQVPLRNEYVPIIPIAVAAAPQMGDPLNTGTIGTMKEEMHRFNDDAACIGECVTSFRQLLKRPGPYIPYTNSKYLVFHPDMYTPIINTTEPVSSSGIAPDLITVLGCCFTLQRGSLRFKFIPHNVTNITDIDSLVTWWYTKIGYNTVGGYPDTTRIVKSSVSSATALSATSIANNARNGSFMAGLTKWGVGFTCPFYNSNHSTPTVPHYTGFSYLPGIMGQPETKLSASVSSVGNLNLTVLRYAGDDFNFGQFNGIPPMYAMTIS